jgi:pSer/pThr/pTyr-binding forkhead associated (FHA) protein
MKIFITGETESFSHTMEKNHIVIGRQEGCDFHVPHDELSRKHCEIIIEDEIISIIDLGSKNGVYVDGIRIQPNTKTPININSLIMLSHRFNLTFMRRPNQTNLGFTGQIEVEKPPLRKPTPSRRYRK